MKVRLTNNFLRDIEVYNDTTMGNGITGCIAISCEGINCKDCNLAKMELNGRPLHISKFIEKGLIEE